MRNEAVSISKKSYSGVTYVNRMAENIKRTKRERLIDELIRANKRR
jgi:hypothetical protein